MTLLKLARQRAKDFAAGANTLTDYDKKLVRDANYRVPVGKVGTLCLDCGRVRKRNREEHGFGKWHTRDCGKK